MCVSIVFHCKKSVELLESIIIPLNKTPEVKRNRKQTCNLCTTFILELESLSWVPSLEIYKKEILKKFCKKLTALQTAGPSIHTKINADASVELHFKAEVCSNNLLDAQDLLISCGLIPSLSEQMQLLWVGTVYTVGNFYH